MPEKNVIVETAKCIWVSLDVMIPEIFLGGPTKKTFYLCEIEKTFSFNWQCSWVEKSKRGKKEKLPETLDYAENRFGKSFVDDVKALKNVSYMFIPFPLFWALFDQQVTFWFYNEGKLDTIIPKDHK